MPLSPGQTKFNHYMNYLPPITYMVVGVVIAGMPFFIDGGKDLEMTIILGLFGLCLFGWGAFGLWRHSRSDPAAPVYTVDDLPVDQRVRALRRFMVLVPIGFTPAAALMGYELMRVEYGWARSVSVWAPVAFVYNSLGFWPAVLLIPVLGLLLMMYLGWKLRAIRESNPTTTGPQ